MPNIKESHAHRIGCSQLAQALGITRNFGTRYDLWAQHTGRQTRQDIGNELRVALGEPMEEVLKPFVEARLGRKLRRDRVEYVHHTLPLVAHLDFRAEKVKGERYRPVVDMKTSLGWGARHRFGEDGTDEVDDGVLLQMQGYTLLTGAPVAYVAALVPGPELNLYIIEADKELHQMIEAGVADFWKLVETDTPPAPETEAEARQRWQRHQPGKIQTVDASLEVAIKTYAAEKARLAECEKTCQRLRDAIIPALEDADIIQTDGGLQLATYRANKDSQRTDWKALVHHHWPVPPADLVEQFTTTQPGARVLRLAKDLERML